MKVAVFVDGKNFYSGYKATAPDRMVDFPGMASWLVKEVNGSFLWGVYYYTGIETGNDGNSQEQAGLRRFLEMMETLPGFFVYRFPRKSGAARCLECQAINRFTREKEVDTTMVADMLRLAAVDAFDILVLISGDADHAPAVEGVRSLGKQAYVATWGRCGLSDRIRKAAFDHIDLGCGITEFATGKKSVPENGHSQSHPGVSATPATDPSEDDRDPTDEKTPAPTADDEFLRELKRAEQKFSEGYVGANYFIRRWKAERLSPLPEVRQRILDRLIDAGRVEAYTASDKAQAIRLKEPTNE